MNGLWLTGARVVHRCRWLALLLLAGSCANVYAQTSPAGALAGEAPPGTARVVLYLPGPVDLSLEPPPPIDWDLLRTNLPDYLRIPLSGTSFTHIYAPALQRRIDEQPLDPGPQTRCSDEQQGDFFRQELARLTLELTDRAGSEALREGLEMLITRFHCQTGGPPLEREVLRQALLWQAVDYYLVSDVRRRDLQLFGAAYALGTEETLDEGLRGRFGEDNGIWTTYTQAASEFMRQFDRIPVIVDSHQLPYHTIYVDGERLSPAHLARAPLRLYPGLHFLQVVDSRGRVRSATVTVPANQPQVKLELGVGTLFPPERADADELLWLDLTVEMFVLPDWLKAALAGYLADHRLEALYVVAPDGDRQNGPGEPLLVARFDATQGLVEIDRKEQGPRYIPMRERPQKDEARYAAERWIAGGGVSAVGNDLFLGLEGSYAIFSSQALQVQGGAALYHQGLSSSEARLMTGLWLGVKREPQDPKLGWLYGLSLGGVALEWAPRRSTADIRWPLLAVMPRAHVGVEWPLRRYLYDGQGPHYRRTPSLRLELTGAIFRPPEGSSLAAQPLAFMAEGRLSVRMWRRRSIVD